MMPMARCKARMSRSWSPAPCWTRATPSNSRHPASPSKAKMARATTSSSKVKPDCLFIRIDDPSGDAVHDRLAVYAANLDIDFEQAWVTGRGNTLLQDPLTTVQLPGQALLSGRRSGLQAQLRQLVIRQPGGEKPRLKPGTLLDHELAGRQDRRRQRRENCQRDHDF